MTDSSPNISASRSILASRLWARLFEPVSVLPLALFRIAFGLLMAASTLRFVLRGWVEAFYVAPSFHFTYLGFGWVKPLPETGMYTVFAVMFLASLTVALGLFYRVSIISFFLLFTYVELLDKSFYLNHYYFVSLLSFLLIFLPLNRRLSLDTRTGITKSADRVPAWTLYAVRLQLALVYIFAGFAKLNPDWLFNAAPLRIWLRANTDLPVIGWLFDYVWAAYAMSWAGIAYDLSIPFLLLWGPIRPLAYLVVISFHVLTSLLFPIGMFPWIMLVGTLIFFSHKDYCNVARPLRLPYYEGRASAKPRGGRVLIVLSLFFVFQVGMCLRHYAYPGNVLWTEEGFRFSWRVMLTEKTGSATFTVRDADSSQTWLVLPGSYLTPQQERQMSTQPDMILQFAQFVAQDFGARGYKDVSVTAEVYASLNGRSSQLLIDPAVDLTRVENSLAAKPWITALEQP